MKRILKLSVAAAFALTVGPVFGADGAAVYKAKCASCHGKDAKGNPAMVKMFKVDASALDLTDKGTLEKTDEALIDITNKGVRKMPAFAAKLKAEEVSAVVAYVRGLGAPAK